MDKVSIVLTDGRKINLELDRASAPVTVENFLKLVDNGFYNGLCFHRVISGFMIQGGGMVQEKGVLIEKRGLKPIKGEFLNNGVKNDIKHELGVISMARTNEPNSATSQFLSAPQIATFWIRTTPHSAVRSTPKATKSWWTFPT